MLTSQQLRDEAARCRRLIQGIGGPEDRTALLDLAREFEMLADDIDRERKAGGAELHVMAPFTR